MSPPMTVTCETPGNGGEPRPHRPVGEPAQRHRVGLGVGSAPASAQVRATSMISPMIEEIGWICGTTPAGS